MKTSFLDYPDLRLSVAVEAGIRFETGRPVSFPFLHNPDPAPRCGCRYGQDLEPAGRYCLFAADAGVTAHAASHGWDVGRAELLNPIVLEWVGYGGDGWKARLSRACGRKTGKSLSKFLVASGYDSVVTTSGGETREIVLLRRH